MSAKRPPDFAKRHSFGVATDAYPLTAGAAELAEWPMALVLSIPATIQVKVPGELGVTRTLALQAGLFPLAITHLINAGGATIIGMFVK